MARYPLKTPSFATKPYGATEEAWESAKDQAREVLYEWAAAGKYGFYSDLAGRVTAIEWLEGEAFSGQIGWMLGRLSLEELSRDQDRPLLSSLVVGKVKRFPTGGYWQFLSDLGEPVPVGEVNRVAAAGDREVIESTATLQSRFAQHWRERGAADILASPPLGF